MFYTLHSLSTFVQRLSHISVCKVMEHDFGFSDAIVMQVMSRQEYRLKLKRLISNTVSCLVTYSNRYFFLSYSNSNTLESSQTLISSRLCYLKIFVIYKWRGVRESNLFHSEPVPPLVISPSL